MRDPPLPAGKQVCYGMVFHFEEEGKPVQSFSRSQVLALPEIEVLRREPAGWELIRMAVLEIFG